MNKQQAAAFLGISTRTLERISRDGRLSKGRARVNGRPVAVYDVRELELLKDELQKSAPVGVFGRPNTERPTDVLAFRLDPFYVTRLVELGAQTGQSPAEFARRLVILGVEELDSARLSESINQLRQALADMFYLVLVTKLGATEEEATEIVLLISRGVQRC